MTSTLKIVTVWLLLGVSLFVAFNEWQRQRDLTRFTAQEGTIEIRRGPDGHYHWPGQIDGHPVDFLVDTGATRSAMSRALADQLELKTEGQVQSTTANGVVTGSTARVDLSLRGGVLAERLRIVVLPNLGDKPLLGMDVLGRLNLHQRNGVLRIVADTGDK
ncbi:TIGR02281 family clan AA aspartic protease [soil metagenome]